MSNENLTDDVKKKVAIGAEDCENFFSYCKHFGVPYSDDLKNALEKFSNEPTFENQQLVKLEVCKWILEGKHESFQDSLWDAPKKVSEEVVYDLQFEKDLKEELTKDDGRDGVGGGDNGGSNGDGV